MIMNEVRNLYNDDGCVLKEASSNDYESWSSARTLGPMERRKEYRNLCYNFEYIILTISHNIANVFQGSKYV